MNSPVEIVSNFIGASHLATFFLDALLKGLAVLAAAGGLLLVWRRASATTRHLIWFLALASLPLLPLLSAVSPSWPRPLWSVSADTASGNQVSLQFGMAPPAAASDPVPEAAATRPRAVDTGASHPAGQLVAARFDRSWLAVGPAVWSCGVLLVLAYVTFGQLQLRKISRGARRVQPGEWTPLLRECCQTLRVRRPVTLLQAAENMMPLTWGWWRPVVLLPAEAEQWPAERRRIVLLHELAHIKRGDCLTQFIARIVCALYWFNPLAWLAAQRMRVERERACDDLVLNGGCRASDYAGHLVEIARRFRRVPRAAAIAMARSAGLEKRIAAIVDASRVRTLQPATVWAILVLAGALIFCVGGWSAESGRAGTSQDTALWQRQVDQLKVFSAAKLRQSQLLAAASGEEISPEFQRFFDAATGGDWQTVTNMYGSFHARHHQYERVKGIPFDPRLTTSFWGPVLEISLAYDHVLHCDARYTQIAVDDVINSIPRGSIYFGGTDPGRGLPTAFSRSQADADPFYTVTQNALADSTYLAYVCNTYGERRHWLVPLSEGVRADAEAQSLIRQYQDSCETFAKLLSTYPADDPQCKAAETTNEDLRIKVGKRTDQVLADLQSRTDPGKKAQLLAQAPPAIYIPTDDESQKAFADYTADAGQRLAHDQEFPNEPRQVKPGEGITRDANGKIQVSGQIAVMSINALLVKIIFDKNPDREFYIEESFPLDWMYPQLEPHGLIMKINRQPLAELSAEVVQQDHDFWQRRVNEMVGDWLTDDTPVSAIAEWAEKVYGRKDLSGFTGDPRFVRDDYSPKMFAKWRASIGGIYAWRIGAMSGVPTPPEYLPKNDAERQRMVKAAEFAYRQAFALCPYSPEAVFRYINLLVSQKRFSDAVLIADAASHIDPRNGQLKDVAARLKQAK